VAETMVLKRGRATFQHRRHEFMYAGGTLELTQNELSFLPGRFNLGFGPPMTIPLEEIMSVGPIRPLVLGLVPNPWSNGILVQGMDGRFGYVIWVFGRGTWIAAIEAARIRKGSATHEGVAP
jgi:hypothetical protein